VKWASPLQGQCLGHTSPLTHQRDTRPGRNKVGRYPVWEEGRVTASPTHSNPSPHLRQVPRVWVKRSAAPHQIKRQRAKNRSIPWSDRPERRKISSTSVGMTSHLRRKTGSTPQNHKTSPKKTENKEQRKSKKTHLARQLHPLLRAQIRLEALPPDLVQQVPAAPEELGMRELPGVRVRRRPLRAWGLRSEIMREKTSDR
jgi:hypothetical protein